jgi:FAD/FMN-containing dehydrogenase
MQTVQLNQPSESFLNEIKLLVGSNGWKSVEDMPRYFDDPRGRFEGFGTIIVLPNSTEQVSLIVKLCNAEKVGLIPYSGGTGVVAGQLSIDSKDVIILSLERMNKVIEVSLNDNIVIVEAGCILENIHDSVEKHDLIFPLSMASKGSCCIGGNLATNAGGIQVLRYGNARDLCIGIEAVLPCGTILSELNPLYKNNTGYDLKNLLIGSEGTLGVITAATLKLKPIEPESGTALVAIKSTHDIHKIYKLLKTHVSENISAIELMSGFGVSLVTSKFPKLRNPFDIDYKWFLLVEVTGAIGIVERLESALKDCFDHDILLDAIIAQSQQQKDGLWNLREMTPEANKLAGAFCNSDTSVPISKISNFIEDAYTAIQIIHPNLRINSYGHIGDGNIHLNVLPPQEVSKVDFLKNHPKVIEEVRMAINETTHSLGGSISAEHGIGRLKTKDLEIYANKARLKTIKSIKSAMDPNNIMNPGVIIS